MDLSTGVSNMSDGSFHLSSHFRIFSIGTKTFQGFLEKAFSEISEFSGRGPICLKRSPPNWLHNSLKVARYMMTRVLNTINSISSWFYIFAIFKY